VRPRTLAFAAALVLAAPAFAFATTLIGRSPSAHAERGEASLASSTSGGRAPVPDTPQSGPTAVRYRIAGCRSVGAQAYRRGPGSRREVAIGFDDGPAPITPAFVRMLERARAPATFFVIGRQISGAYRELLLRELRDGDVLGDHSFTHPDLVRSGGVRGQLSETISAIRSLTGYTPCVFRPPYGSYDAQTVSTASSLGLATVLWNVDPTDWARPGTAAIVQRVLAQVQPGSIIISHDGGGFREETLAAYPKIIAVLRARRYRIVTIPQLLGFRSVYVSCIKLCDGLGVRRAQVPHGALIVRAP
jgi:peptidoglycan/xylan/chitin deacetylase (PgdA/CDA1 family)